MESGELWTGPILGRRSVVNKRLIFARLSVQQWQSHGQLECSAWEVVLIGPTTVMSSQLTGPIKSVIFPRQPRSEEDF